jgi:hypothetical protein
MYGHLGFILQNIHYVMSVTQSEFQDIVLPCVLLYAPLFVHWAGVRPSHQVVSPP